MSALKIKDAQGNWIEVPMIKGDKGDKGDTYELTQQDKQDIADLVDVPEPLKYIKDDPSDSGGVIEGLVTIPDDAPTGTVANSATGEYAHAEGRGTKAQASASHSEGLDTIADGNWSHAEGGNTYTNRYAESSHAEGYMSKTYGYASHAEGYNSIANGTYSHAEGDSSYAKSIGSHAEGYGTIAGSDYQHVQGKYNIEDNQNIYAFIIGNGTTDNNRSNALAIKWDGSFVFANGTEVTPTEFTQMKDGGATKYYSTTNHRQDQQGNLLFDVDGTLDSTSLANVVIIPQYINAPFFYAGYYTGDNDLTYYVWSSAILKESLGSGYHYYETLTTSDLVTFTFTYATIPLDTLATTNTNGLMSSTDKQHLDDLYENKITDVQINGDSIVTDGVANVPIASANDLGVCLIDPTLGVNVTNTGKLGITVATSTKIKEGTEARNALVPRKQHESVFYGLAKASGDATQAQSNNAVGTYTDEAKASIQTMLGVPSVDDIPVDMIVTITTENEDFETAICDKTFQEIVNAIESGQHVVCNWHIKWIEDEVEVGYHDRLFQTVNYERDFIEDAGSDDYIVSFTSSCLDELGYANDITIYIHYNDTISISYLKTEGVMDVQVNGTSVVTDGVANVPMADNTNLGVVTVDGVYGIGRFSTNGALYINYPTSEYIKSGTNNYRPIVPSKQHESVFYGLAKASGDTTQSASSNAVGTYTDEAKQSIKQMLGVVDSYDSLVVNVTGIDPVITAQPSYRYNCGEVASLTVTPPTSGTIDFIFTSGTTPTVLDLPQTVKMPSWWIGVEANTTYEMCITDGVYCGVMSWDA